MTDTTPAPDTTDILPPEVSYILDEASVEDGPYSARPTATSIQLIETKTGLVVKEAHWPAAGAWAKSVLREVMGALPIQGEVGS